MSSYADFGRIDPQEKDRGLFQAIPSTWEEKRPDKPDPAHLSPASEKIIETLMKENRNDSYSDDYPGAGVNADACA